jgi:formylglycine-generating enzyme required for sulfatase activity
LDAVAFCNQLSLIDGLEPVYHFTGTSVSADFAKSGWRLPNEAEWEYAARGGQYATGKRYAGSNSPDQAGWYHGNAKRRPQPVAAKAPNELGIYDLSGNVEEWCGDWYGLYSAGDQVDPVGPGTGTAKVVRGGSCAIADLYMRVDERDAGKIDEEYANNCGFRVVRR